MSSALGSVGRRALATAAARAAARRPVGIRAPAVLAVDSAALPLVQAAPASSPAAADGGAAPPAAPALMGQATEREKVLPSAEEVADRVYRLFCDDLRRDRERRGCRH